MSARSTSGRGEPKAVTVLLYAVTDCSVIARLFTKQSMKYTKYVIKISTFYCKLVTCNITNMYTVHYVQCTVVP